MQTPGHPLPPLLHDAEDLGSAANVYGFPAFRGA